MFGYVIDPFKKTVTKVDWDGNYQSIYGHIGADCFDTCRFSRQNGDCAFVDDEGLFKPDQAFFLIGEYPTPLAGKALVLGTDEAGDSISPETFLTDLKVAWASPVTPEVWVAEVWEPQLTTGQ